MPVTKTSKEDNVVLERVPYIYYPFRFQKDNSEVKALIKSGSKVKAITLAYVLKLGLKIRQTNTEVQKIDGSILKIFGMVLVSF